MKQQQRLQPFPLLHKDFSAQGQSKVTPTASVTKGIKSKHEVYPGISCGECLVEHTDLRNCAVKQKKKACTAPADNAAALSAHGCCMKTGMGLHQV